MIPDESIRRVRISSMHSCRKCRHRLWSVSCSRNLSEVYAGYFASLSNRGKNREAFGAIERARGRVEAQALEDHEPVAPHEPTTAEKLLTSLNLRLLDTDDVGSRRNILQTIYDTEQQINPN